MALPEILDSELQLLLCAIAQDPKASPFRLRAADGGAAVDPERFHTLVERHRVGALVADAAAEIGLPDRLAAAFRDEEAHNAVAYLRSRALLGQIEGAFSKASIDWVLLKGVPLAERYYSRPALREMIDVDVLVPQNRVDKAQAALIALGFERYHPRYELNNAQRVNFMSLNSAFGYIRKSDGAQLDLHWRTMQNPRFLPVIDGGWQSMVVRDPDNGWPVLPPAADFAYVLAHGAKHGWVRLKWLADVQRMLSTLDSLSAAELAEKLGDYRIEDAAGAAFLLCRELFGAPLPGALEAFAQRPDAKSLGKLSLGLIRSPIPLGGAGIGQLGYLSARIRHSTRLAANRGFATQALIRELARPADLQSVPLPTGWAALLAVVSPILAVGRSAFGRG